MMSSCVPASSKSKRIPNFRQQGANLLMIRIFFPLAALNTDSLASVGVPSKEILNLSSRNRGKQKHT